MNKEKNKENLFYEEDFLKEFKKVARISPMTIFGASFFAIYDGVVCYFLRVKRSNNRVGYFVLDFLTKKKHFEEDSYTPEIIFSHDIFGEYETENKVFEFSVKRDKKGKLAINIKPKQ